MAVLKEKKVSTMTQPNAQSSLLLFENYHHSLFSTSFPNGNASFSHSLLNTNQSDGFFHSQHSPTTTLSLPAHHHYHPSSSSDLPRPHHHHHQQQIDSFPSSFPTPVSCNFSFPRIRRSNPFLLLSGDSSFPTINPSLSEMVHNHSTLNAETSSSTASAISGFKSKTQRQTSFYGKFEFASNDVLFTL